MYGVIGLVLMPRRNRPLRRRGIKQEIAIDPSCIQKGFWQELVAASVERVPDTNTSYIYLTCRSVWNVMTENCTYRTSVDPGVVKRDRSV
jgi:hypothetical protein